MEVEEDQFRDPRARDLGMGQDEASGYLSENRDQDYNEALAPGVPEEIPIQDQPDDDFGEPGEGDSFVGLGESTGTEQFDQDPRLGGIGSPQDEAEVGDADFRTQEAVYQQYTERLKDERTR